MQENNLAGETIHATGGGAHKYAELFDKEFGSRGVQVKKHDEMASMVNGFQFVLQCANRSAYSVSGSPTRLPNEPAQPDAEGASNWESVTDHRMRSYEEEK